MPLWDVHKGKHGINNCIVWNKCRRYAFKINNCTGHTLREGKSETRKECRTN